jgi:hypothetical protein
MTVPVSPRVDRGERGAITLQATITYMPTRNRHEIIDDTEPTYTCAVCNTENDTHNGNAIEFYRLTPREQGKPTSIELCMECVEDFKSEVLAGDEDVDEAVMDTDTLPDDIFDRLEAWAHKAAVLTFTERENQVRNILDMEQFFDALSKLLVWHPDSRFADYTNMEDTYESAMAHDSSENGCHPDCRACADEEKHHQMFTDEDASALDAVMAKCFEVVETCGPKGKDIYSYGLDALQRAGLAPKDATEKELAQEGVAQAEEQRVYERTMGQPTRGESEMAQENKSIPEAVKLVIEASRLIADDVNEESSQWRAQADKFIKGLTLAQSSSAQVVILADSEDVLIFQSKEGLQAALEWQDKESNQDGGNLTEYLRKRNVHFITVPGAVFFNTR